jgi:hypothetical protein
MPIATSTALLFIIAAAIVGGLAGATSAHFYYIRDIIAAKEALDDGLDTAERQSENIRELQEIVESQQDSMEELVEMVDKK